MKLTRILLAFLAFTAPLLAEAKVELTFGIYATDRPTEVVKKFKPLLSAIEKDMSKRLGEAVKIKIIVSKSYEEGVSNLSSGKVDFSRFGPASYIIATQQNPGVSILAMESKKGKKEFFGIICVQQDSNIQSLADLKGKRFAFGNQQSTIGRYLSQSQLMEAEVFAKDLESFDYLGRHDKVGAAVAAGKYDAGALKESTFKKLVKKGSKLREIARFKNVTKPWIASPDLSLSLRTALTETLLSLKDKKALGVIKKATFVAASKGDYEDIRSSMEENARFEN